MSVFVLYEQKQPLMPCSKTRPRLVLESERAGCFPRYGGAEASTSKRA